MKSKRVLAAFAFLALAPGSSFAWECQGVLIRAGGPTSAAVGTSAKYTFHIANEGSCELQGALVTDFIPRRTLFKSASPTPSGFPGKVVVNDRPVDNPPPSPVDKVEWKDVALPPAAPLGDYEVNVEVLGPAGRVMTNTVCIEHPKTGRICDTIDTYVKG